MTPWRSRRRSSLRRAPGAPLSTRASPSPSKCGRTTTHSTYTLALIFTQTIPTIALAPILVLWLGYDMTPKIVLIVINTTFPIVISILDGFRHCDKDAIQLLKLMNASRWQILYHVKIPTALTYFYAGLRVSVSYAFISAVVSEWLGGFEGLGVFMIRAKKAFDYDTMFAIIILVSAISLISMELVKRSEKKFIKWKYLEEEENEED